MQYTSSSFSDLLMDYCANMIAEWLSYISTVVHDF